MNYFRGFKLLMALLMFQVIITGIGAGTWVVCGEELTGSTGETKVSEELTAGTEKELPGTGETIINEGPTDGTGETNVREGPTGGTGETEARDELTGSTGETKINEGLEKEQEVNMPAQDRAIAFAPSPYVNYDVVVAAPWEESEVFRVGLGWTRNLNYFQVFESDPWTVPSGSTAYGSPEYYDGNYGNQPIHPIPGFRYRGSSVRISREGITKVSFYHYLQKPGTIRFDGFNYVQDTMVYIDKTPPSIGLINSRNGYVYGSRLKINVKDTLSGIREVSFANASTPGAFVACNIGTDYPGGPAYYYIDISQGTTQISGTVRTVDNAGNVLQTPVNCVTDSEGPQIQSLSAGTDWTVENTLKLSVNDSVSGVESVQYSFDNATWGPVQPSAGGSYSITIPKERIGNSILYIKAQDKAGNQRNVNFDFTNPVLSGEKLYNGTNLDTPYNGQTQWSGTSLRICFTASDSHSGLGDVWYKKGTSTEWKRIEEEYKGKATWNFNVTINKNYIINEDDLVKVYDGTVDFKIKDQAGNYILKSFPVKIDGGKPAVTVNNPQEADRWSTEDITVSASAEDKETGIASIQYSVENGGKVVETGEGSSVTVKTDGISKITFSAYDKAGNCTQASTEVRIDKTGPQITLSSTVPEGQWAASDVVTAGAEDSFNGVAAESIAYALYDAEGQKISEGKGDSVTIGQQGVIRVEFSAEDKLGNRGTGSTTVKIDTVIPSIKAHVVLLDADGKVLEERDLEDEALSSNASKVRLVVTAEDNVSGVKGVSYKRNGDTSFTAGSQVEISTDGTSVIEIKAEDNAGNVNRITKTISIDTRKPVIKIGESYWTNKDFVLVQVKQEDVSDAGSGADFDSLEYRIGEEGQWVKGNTVKVTQKGPNQIFFRVKDRFGNIGEVSTIAGVDDILPKAAVTYLPEGIGSGGWTNRKDVTAHIEFTDEGGSGFSTARYSLDGGETWIECTGNMVDIPVKKNGENRILYKAEDKAGNMLEGESKIVLDFESPKLETSVKTQGVVQRKWTHLPEVTVAAKASDDLSGVDEATWEYTLENGSVDKGTGNEVLIEKDGVTVVSFLVKDRAGNSSVEKMEIWIDRTAPEIKELLLADAHIREQIKVKSLISEDTISGVESVLWRIPGVNDWDVMPDQRILNVPAALKDGLYSLEVKVTDVAGNETVKTIEFELDKTSPVLSGVSLREAEDSKDSEIEDGQYITGQNVFAFVKAWDEFEGKVKSGIKEYRYLLTRQWLEHPDFSKSQISENASFPVKDLGNGIMYLYIQAVDLAGNESKYFVRTLKIDQSGCAKPQIMGITHPEAETVEDAVAEKEAVFSLIPGKSGISGVKEYLFELYKGEQLVKEGSNTGLKLTLENLEDNLPEEYYLLKVCAVSGGGLKSEWAKYRFRVDTQPPVNLKVFSSTHANPKVWYASPSAVLLWQKPLDFTGVKSYYYKTGTSPDSVGTLSEELKNSPLITATKQTMVALDLKKIAGANCGTVYFTLWAEDFAGNRQMDVREIRFDAVPPTIGKLEGSQSGLSVVPDAVDRSVQVTWGTPADNIQVSHIELGIREYDQKAYQWRIKSTEETSEVFQDLKADTMYVICVKAVDTAGNSSSISQVFDLRGIQNIETSVPFSAVVGGFTVTGTLYSGTTPHEAVLEIPSSSGFTGGSTIALEQVQADDQGFLSGESPIEYQVNLHGFQVSGKGLSISRERGLVLKEATYKAEITPGEYRTFTYKNVAIAPGMSIKESEPLESEGFEFRTVNPGDSSMKDGFLIRNITQTGFENDHWVIYKGQLDLSAWAGYGADGDNLTAVKRFELSSTGVAVDDFSDEIFYITMGSVPVKITEWRIESDRIFVSKADAEFSDGFLLKGNSIRLENFSMVPDGRISREDGFLTDLFSFMDGSLCFKAKKVDFELKGRLMIDGSIICDDGREFSFENAVLASDGIDYTVAFTIRDFETELFGFPFKAEEGTVSGDTISFDSITGEFPEFLGGKRTFKGLTLDKSNHEKILRAGLAEGTFQVDTGFGSKVTLGGLTVEKSGIRCDGAVVKLPDFMGGKEHRFGDMLLTVEGLCPMAPEDFDFNIAGFAIHGRGAALDFDKISLDSVEIECPKGFSDQSITLYDVAVGPKGFVCKGTGEVEMEYSYGGFTFGLSKVTLDEDGLLCDGRLAIQGKALNGVLEVKDLRIGGDGSFSGGRIEGGFQAKLYGIEAAIYNISLSQDGLRLDADIKAKVFGENKVEARGVFIKPDGSIQGTLSIPVDFNFTSLNGFAVKVNRVVLTESGIRLKGSVSLPGCMDSGKSLDFKDVELILHEDGSIEAAGALEEAAFTIAGFAVTARNIVLGTDGISIEKGLLDIMSPGFTLEFGNLALDSSGKLKGEITIRDIPEFSRSGWNFNIQRLTLSGAGIQGDFDIRMPEGLGGDRIHFKDAAFLSKAPYVKMNVVLEQLCFSMGKVLFELQNADFSLDGIAAQGGWMSFKEGEELRKVQLPSIKISSNGSFLIQGAEIPAFDLWGYEIHVTEFGLSDEKVKMKGWLKINEDFGIKELAGKRVDINQLVINKEAQVEFFDCSYSGGISFDAAPGIRADIGELGISSDAITVKKGKLTLSSDFPGFLKSKELGIKELKVSHLGKIISLSSEEILIAGEGKENPVLGRLGITSGTVQILKDSREAPVKVSLKGTMVLPQNLPGGLGGTELDVKSLILDGSGKILNVEASGVIPEDCVLEAGIKIRGGTIAVLKDSMSGGWLLGVTGNLRLPEAMPGDLASSEVQLSRFVIDSDGKIIALEAGVDLKSGSVLYGGIKVKNGRLSLMKTEENPAEINIGGTLILPASAPGVLSGMEIAIQSLKFNAAGQVKEMIAQSVLKGEHTLVGGIRYKDVVISMEGQGDLSLKGKLVLPSEGPECFKNEEIEIDRFVIRSDGSIKELNAGLQKQGKYELMPNIDVLNPGVHIEHQGDNFNFSVSGTFTLGDIFPEGLKGKTLEVEKLSFDGNGKILAMDLTMNNINATFFSSVEVMDGSMRVAAGGGSGEILFSIGGLIKLTDSLPTGLGGKTFAIKECLISSKDGIKKFMIHDPQGRYFNLCGSGAQGRFYEAGLGDDGLELSGEVVFNSDFVIEGLSGTTIELKKLKFGWDGKIKEINASIAAMRKSFGGFTADIENFEFYSDGIRIGKLDIILPDNMGNKRFGVRDAGIRRDGSFYGTAVAPDFTIGYAGFKLKFEEPMLKPSEKRISFKSVVLKCPDVAGNKEFGLNGVVIKPSGISFTGGKFSLPNFTVSNTLSFRDIKVDFMIDGNNFRVAGQGAAFIQGAGTFKAEVAFRDTSSTYPIGLEYAEFSYTLSGQGIPIANTGLYMYEIRGGLGFGPPGSTVPPQIASFLDTGIRIHLGASIHDGSGTNAINGAGDIWMDVKDFQWGLKADITVLKGIARGTAITLIDKDSFYSTVDINITFARGSAFIYVFKHNGGVAISGGGDVQFGLREGSIWRAPRVKVFGHTVKLGPDIPWDDWWLFGGGVEFGLFNKGGSDVGGVKGWVDVPLWGDVGVFVTSGDIDFTNISEYHIYKPGMASSSGDDTKRNIEMAPLAEGQGNSKAEEAAGNRVTLVTGAGKNVEKDTYAFDVPQTATYQKMSKVLLASANLDTRYAPDVEPQNDIDRIVFVVGYVEGDPEVVLISPSGKEYRQGDAGVLAQHVDNGVVMAVLNPEPGQWRAEVRNVPEGMYVVQAFGKTIVLELTVATPGNQDEKANGLYSVEGICKNAKAGSKVTVYVSEEKGSYAGKPAGETTVLPDGSYTAKIDAMSLADGKYYVYAALELPDDQPRVMKYAEGSLTVYNADVPLNGVQNLIVSGDGESALEVRFEDTNGYRTKGFNLYVKNVNTGEEEVINLGSLTKVTMPGYTAEDKLEIAVAPYDNQNREGEKSSYIKTGIKEDKKEINSFQTDKNEISLKAAVGETVHGSLKVMNVHPETTGTAYDYADGVVVEAEGGIRVSFDQEAVDIAKEEAIVNYAAYIPEGTLPGEYTVKAEIQNRGNRELKQEVTFKVTVVYPEVKVGSVTPYEWNSQENTELDIYGDNFYDGTTVSLNGKPLEITEKDNMHMKVRVPAGTAGGKAVLAVTGPGGGSVQSEVDIWQPQYNLVVYKNRAEIKQGSSSAYYFELAGDFGYSGEVSFTAQEVPAGWSVKLDKDILKAGEMGIATVTVPEETTEGNYGLKIVSQYGDEIPLTVTVVKENPAPFISCLYRDSVNEGATADIFGYGFGDTGKVKLEGKNLKAVRYGKDRITVEIPEGSKSGNITVETGKKTSNAVKLYVTQYGIKLYPEKEHILLSDGGTADIPVQIKGNAGKVNLGVKSSSRYVQAVLDKTEIVPNAQVSLNIQVQKGAPSGVYRLRLEARGDKIRTDKIIEVEVKGAKAEKGPKWYFQHAIVLDKDGKASIELIDCEKEVYNVTVSFRIEEQGTRTCEMQYKDGSYTCELGTLLPGSLITYSFRYQLKGKGYETQTYRYVHGEYGKPCADSAFGVGTEPGGKAKIWLKANRVQPNGSVTVGIRIKNRESHEPMQKDGDVWEKEVTGLKKGDRIEIRLFYNTTEGSVEVPWFVFTYDPDTEEETGEKLTRDDLDLTTAALIEVTQDGQNTYKNGYYNRSPRILIKRRDYTGKKLPAYYSINGSAPKPAQGELRLQDGEYTLETYVYYEGGLKKDGNTVTLKVDTIMPVVEGCVGGDKSGTNTYSTATVTLTATDSGSGMDFIEYSTDGNRWYSYEEPITLDKDGNYTVRYRAVDKAGNRSHEKQTNSIIIRRSRQ